MKPSTQARHSKTSGASGRLGFSLIEVVVAMAVLTVSALAMSATLASTHALENSNRSRRSAENALRSVGEQILAFSDGARDDPAGWSAVVAAALAPGGAIGNTFNVRGLTLPAGVQAAGSIQLIVDETVADAVLGVKLGMPRDLNGDGVALDANVTASAVLLPVVVQINWFGATGAQTVSQAFFLLGY